MVTSLTLGGLGVLAVQLSPHLEVAPAAGATLMAAFGVGNLVASLVVTAWPLRGEPERSTTWAVAVIGAVSGRVRAGVGIPGRRWSGSSWSARLRRPS